MDLKRSGNFHLIYLIGLMCLATINCAAGCSTYPIKDAMPSLTSWKCNEEADQALKILDYNTGILLHERFIEREPSNALVFYHLGYAYGQINDHEKEISFYEKAIALGFNGSNIFFNLGMAYADMGENRKADAQLREIQVIDPNNEMALELLKEIEGK
jgi:tetratricopeptide (TPR) repeat protein